MTLRCNKLLSRTRSIKMPLRGACCVPDSADVKPNVHKVLESESSVQLRFLGSKPRALFTFGVHDAFDAVEFQSA